MTNKISTWLAIMGTMSLDFVSLEDRIAKRYAPQRKRGKYLKAGIYAHCYGYVGRRFKYNNGYISKRRIKKGLKL